MQLIIFPGFFVLAVLSLRGARWAYIVFVLYPESRTQNLEKQA
jgi:hypothetical protein